MITQVVAPDSPFVFAMLDATAMRRSLVAQGHVPRTLADSLLADRERLAQLANHCFWASLAAEEGRQVRGSVCICSPGESSGRALAQPVPVTQASLVAFLTASPDQPIGVQLGKEGLEIWGIVDSVSPMSPRMAISGVGTVVALAAGDTVAVVHEGEVHATPNVGWARLTMLVADALGENRPFPEQLTLSFRALHVVRAMHHHRHGGAVLVVPAATGAWETSIHFPFKFDDDAANVVPSRIATAEAATKASLENATAIGQRPDAKLMVGLHAATERAHNTLIETTLRSIGRLTAIDGAVVMTNEIRVLGFGAKIQTAPASFEVARVNVVTSQIEKNLPPAKLGGTRHQSAAGFVHAHKDCVAIVSSQDGRLTLLRAPTEPGVVVAIVGLEHCLWGEAR